MATTHTIAVTTHGRYLMESPAGNDWAGLVVGCHGYGEGAEPHLERLRSIAGAGAWMLLSVQALHRFYRGRSEDVVASWMTRQDRDLAIADNIAYVTAVIDRVCQDHARSLPMVFTGFSQGVAMAYRAACALRRPVAGIVAVGADVPPELTPESLARVPAALIVRGKHDDWYTAEKWSADRERLQTAGVDVRAVEFKGGHEWTADVSREAGALLERVGRRTS